MNLIKDPWIPIRRKSRKRELIAPWQLTETDDPVIALDVARPDFNGALMQFLIGLLQTAVAPDDEDQWIHRLEDPPSLKVLKESFNQYSDAFELQSDKGAFMQDFDALDDADFLPIERLLIDSPGEETLKKNVDHFVKRERAKQLCPSCTATALFTLQVNAPGGGRGHRGSLRGGGPLTTLVILDENSVLPYELWRNLWLNVLEKPELEDLTNNENENALADIFPWLAKTKTSKIGEETTPTHAHVNPLQMYWGMPRRIRIKWETGSEGYCNLCGMETDQPVTHYQTKPYGINYAGAWQHPLTPYSLKRRQEAEEKQREAEKLVFDRLQPNGITYQHWLRCVEDYDNKGWHYSARVVKRYKALLDRSDSEEILRLYAFGYDVNKMKARCWYETTFPLYTIAEEIRMDFSKRIQSLTETASAFAGFVEKYVKEAWFKRPGDAKGDTTFLKQSFYQHTESAFYRAAERLRTKLLNETDKEILQEWHGVLRKAALSLFDYWSIRGDFTQANPRRVAAARSKLRKMFYSRNIRQELQLPDKAKEAA